MIFPAAPSSPLIPRPSLLHLLAGILPAALVLLAALPVAAASPGPKLLILGEGSGSPVIEVSGDLSRVTGEWPETPDLQVPGKWSAQVPGDVSQVPGKWSETPDLQVPGNVSGGLSQVPGKLSRTPDLQVPGNVSGVLSQVPGKLSRTPDLQVPGNVSGVLSRVPGSLSGEGAGDGSEDCIAQLPEPPTSPEPSSQQATRSHRLHLRDTPALSSGSDLDPASGPSDTPRQGPDEALDIAHRLVDRSGAGRRLDQSAARLTLRLRDSDLQLPAAFLQDFTHTLTGAFDSDALRQRLALRLARDLDPATLAAVDAFYDSRLGRRVAFLEHRVDTPQGLEGLAPFVDQILETPPSEHRVALLHSIDRASLAVDTRLDVSVQLLHAILGGLQPFLTADQRLSPTDLTVELVAYRHEIQSTLRSQMYILQLYAYHDLTDAQLADYLDFWHSRAGQAFARVLANGLPATLERAGRTGAEQLAHLARQPSGDQVAWSGPASP